MSVKVTQGPEAVPISVLSQRSGVSIATIKYYIREGLIRSNQDPRADDAETVEQLRLIRGLVHVVGLSILQVRQILALVQDPAANPATSMTDVTVVLPLAGARPTERSAKDADLASARAALASAGFDDLPDVPYVTQLLAAISLAEDCGVGMDADHLATYAAAARACAEADFDNLPLDSPGKAAQAAVLGTAIYDPILVGLRRLAHRERAAHLPSTQPQ